MKKGKRYFSTVMLMLLISLLAIVLLGTLTYLFKWQSDKARIGIVVTYILAGSVGGFCLRDKIQIEWIKRVKMAVTIGTAYIFVLWLVSYFVIRIPYKFSMEFILIWLIVVCSSYVVMKIKSHSP